MGQGTGLQDTILWCSNYCADMQVLDITGQFKGEAPPWMSMMSGRFRSVLVTLAVALVKGCSGDGTGRPRACADLLVLTIVSHVVVQSVDR